MFSRSAAQVASTVVAAFVLSSVTPSSAQDVRQQLADERLPFDREQFRKSGTSVARGDLLACRNRDQGITQPRDITVEEFSNAIHGVWINQNRRTVHGLPVVTDEVMYIDMHDKKGGKGTAIIIDRNNQGKPVLTSAYQDKNGNLAKSLSQPFFLAQVNCSYEFVDHFVKAADRPDINALIGTTKLGLPAGSKAVSGKNLRDVWKSLVTARYFEFVNMQTKTLVGGPSERVRRKLGDKVRKAIMPEGKVVTEGDIEQGLAIGGEYHLPMLVGGFFEITIEPKKRRLGDREYSGVHMRWEAEYRGTGIGIDPGEAVAGVEQGEFFAEGNAFVSARGVSGNDAWATSSCGNKNGLASRITNVGRPGEVTTTAVLTPELVFERFVIGRP